MTNKIRNPFFIYPLLILIFSTGTARSVHSQQNPYGGPPVTRSMKEFSRQVKDDSAKGMIELKSLVPGLQYDLRYASTHNFMKRRMYPSGMAHTYLRAPAARALQLVQQELNKEGLGLKIFDAYRPYSVTVKFWELVQDERYVAHPGKGSGHNRGIAVDLTLIRLDTGEELDMGTGFDNFTDTAHTDYRDLPEAVLHNRQTLRSAMENQGFKVLSTEWWHFYLPESSRYEVLDLSFRELNRHTSKN